MRTLSLLLVLVATSAVRAQHVADDENKEGFISLFNGKDFSGWRFQTASPLGAIPKNWSVGERTIQLSGGGSPHIGTQWPLDDFDFRFQWKAHKKGYNSGFYVRSGRNVGANQINLAEKDCGHLMGGPKGGKAVPDLQKPVGEWNDWRALAEGDKLTFWCNGKEAWSVTGFKPAGGYVGFQAEGAAIDFKNIRVREFGYTVLGDLSDWTMKGGWFQDGDILIAGGDAEPLTSIKPYQKLTLRLEFRGDKFGLAFGGDKQATVALGDGELAKLANPAGQWNYLQITVAGGQAKVWLNGADVKAPVDVSADAGPLRIIPGSEMRFRNIRIRDVK